MKFLATNDRKAFKENRNKLSYLDRAILDKCYIGMNIVRVLKAGKPFVNKYGNKEFATTDEIMASVDKLLKLKLLDRR